MAGETTEKILLQLNLDVNQINAALVDVKKKLTEEKTALKETQDALKSAFSAGNTAQVEHLTQQIVLQEAKVRGLTTSQRNLQKQLDLNTKANEAQNGSYEQLLRQYQLAEIELKTLEGTLQQNADGTFEFTSAYIEAAKQVASAKDAIDQFNLSVNDGRSNVGQYSKALQPLNQEVKGIKESQQALNRTISGATSLFAVTAILTGENTKASQLQKDALTALTVIQNLNNVRLGIASSLQAANAIKVGVATAAISAQTVATGALASIQTYLQVQFGLSAVAARGFAIALAATGIGAIVVLIGLLIGQLAALASQTEDTKDKTDEFRKSMEEADKTFKETISDFDHAIEVGTKNIINNLETEIELLKIRGGSLQELYNLELKLINSKLTVMKNAGDADEAEYNELLNSKKILTANYYADLAKQREDELSKQFDFFFKQEKLQEDAIKKALEATDGFAELRSLVDEEIFNQQLEQERQITEFTKQELEKRLQLQEQHEDAKRQLLSFGLQELFNLNNAFTESRIQQIEAEQKAGIISEEKAKAEILKIRQRQALADKSQAIFNILLNQPVALSKVLAQLGIFGPAAMPFIAGLIALQVAAVAARPLPAFAKGGYTGSGTPGKDDRTIAVSGEEYVLNPRAVKAIGIGRLNEINFSQYPAFARGGFVNQFADGGYAGRFAVSGFDTEILQQAFRDAIIDLPPSVVRVTEINDVQAKVIRVESGATI